MEKFNDQMWHKKSDVDDNNTERARQSEKMVKFLSFAKNIPALKGKSVEDIFSSEENKREFIKNLTDDDFIYLLKGTNALLRGKEIDSPEMDWQMMKVEGVLGLIHESFSHRKDKPELFSLLLKSMQEMNQKGKSIEDMALLCGVSINAIHGFGDGNGRTSRFVYSMLNNNLDNALKKNLKEILSTDGKEDIIDICPAFIGYQIDNSIEKEVGIARKGKNKTSLCTIENCNPAFLKEKISENDFEEFSNILEKDKQFALYAIFGCFENSKDIKKYIHPEYKGVFDINSFLKALTEEEIKQMIKKYWELKKRKVEILIDCIAHPEKDKYQIKEDGRKISMKDYLAESIKNGSKEKKQRKKNREKRDRERNQKYQKELAEALVALEQGGNNHTIHDPNILNSLRKIEKELKEIVLTESQEIDSQSHESDDGKIEKIKDILHKMAMSINKDANISQESINAYLNSKKQEILKNYSKYIVAEKVLSFLNKSDIFKAKFSVTKIGYKPYNISQEELLDDLLTQSVYYIAPNNSSLRIKLYNINTDKEITQPIMEQVFFYTHGEADEINENIIKFNFNLDLDKFFQEANFYMSETKTKIFEISSPEFDREIKKQEDTEIALNSPLKTFKKDRELYVKIPKGYAHHMGYYIDHAEKLK